MKSDGLGDKMNGYNQIQGQPGCRLGVESRGMKRILRMREGKSNEFNVKIRKSNGKQAAANMNPE